MSNDFKNQIAPIDVTKLPAAAVLELVDPNKTGVKQEEILDPRVNVDLTGIEVPGGQTISPTVLEGLRAGHPIVQGPSGDYSIKAPDGVPLYMSRDDVAIIQGLAEQKFAGQAPAAVTQTPATAKPSDVIPHITPENDPRHKQQPAKPVEPAGGEAPQTTTPATAKPASVTPASVAPAAVTLGEGNQLVRDPRVLKIQEGLEAKGFKLDQFGADGICGAETRGKIAEAFPDLDMKTATLDEVLQKLETLEPKATPQQQLQQAIGNSEVRVQGKGTLTAEATKGAGVTMQQVDPDTGDMAPNAVPANEFNQTPAQPATSLDASLEGYNKPGPDMKIGLA